MAEKDNYFKTPSLIWLILVPIGMALVSIAYLSPQHVPFSLLGPLGTLTKYLVDNQPAVLKFIFYAAWILHVYEAYLTSKMCKRRNLSSEATMKWTLQTFLYGIFSLSLLKAYKPSEKLR